jgi:hypothetical protein
MVDPGWTRYLVASTECRPMQGVDAWHLREGEWIGDKVRSSIYGIVKPLVHEIAQRFPRTFTLTDSLIGQRHCVFAITCAHSVSRLRFYLYFLHSLIYSGQHAANDTL